jgi:hypothetical protein
MNLYVNRHSHVPCRTYANSAGRQCEQTLVSLWRPTIPEVPFHRLILKVELVVVGKDFRFFGVSSG